MVLDQRLHPLQRQFGVTDRGLLLGNLGSRRREIRLSLIEGVKIIGMVDFDEQLIGLHKIALVHIQFGNVSIDTGIDVHDLIRRDIRGVGQPDVQVLFQRSRGCDRDHPGFLWVDFGAAAEAENDERRNGEEDNDA